MTVDAMAPSQDGESPDQNQLQSSQAPQEGEGVETDLSRIMGALNTALDRLDLLDRRLGEMEARFASCMEKDDIKQRMFDAMRVELDQHRQNVLGQAKNRLIKALMVFHDNVSAALRNASGETGKELQYVLEELQGVLYAEGVEPILVDVGDPFDGRKHRAIRRIATQESAEDKTIGAVHRVGFAWEEKILRPAEVDVRRYEPACNDGKA